jgi:hypothetical protein
MTWFRRAGQEITRIIQSAAAPGAISDVVTGFAKAVAGTDGVAQFFARSPDFSRQVSGTGCNIFDKPLEPDPHDDEFDSTTLDPAWQFSGGWTQGGINPFAAPVGNALYELHTERRPSWLMVQAPISSAYRIWKPISFAGDFFMWARGSFNLRSASITNNDPNVAFGLSTNPFDANNSILVQINESDANVMSAVFTTVIGGAGTNVQRTRNLFATNSGGQPIEAVGLQKIGTTYHAWVFNRSGNAIWLGSATFNPTVASVFMVLFNASNAAPGIVISGVDFIRFKEGSTFLP